MPRSPVDPSRLEGEDLNRWYLRTPDELEAERQATETQRRRDFFNQAFEATDAAPLSKMTAEASENDVLWVANGYGGYRAARPDGGDLRAPLDRQGPSQLPNYLPDNAATVEDGEFVEAGNPHNPRIKQKYIKKHGSWPKTSNGRDYDVSHVRAIADGGTNTLDNIEPMHPDEHRAKHIRDRDYERWAKRQGIARAFGGRVEPPAHAPKLRGLGFLGLLPNLTGILNGRIRTDTSVHFWNDLMGYSSEDDLPAKDLIA